MCIRDRAGAALLDEHDDDPSLGPDVVPLVGQLDQHPLVRVLDRDRETGQEAALGALGGLGQTGLLVRLGLEQVL